MTDAAAGLEGFSEPVRRWFAEAFEQPTPVQREAWAAIAAGAHALVVAPTGSGKTLAAFLQAIDRLATVPRPANQTDVEMFQAAVERVIAALDAAGYPAVIDSAPVPRLRE